jgi:hypothetical protein
MKPFNVHTAAPLGFPGSEIRGFLVPVQQVPEPYNAGPFVDCSGGLGLARRPRRRGAGACWTS